MFAKSEVQRSADLTGAEPPPSVGAGHLIAGTYRVERVLGHDSLGCVAAATNLRLKERVSLRFLRPTGPEQAERVAGLVREAQRATAVENEHLPRVQDVGALDDGTSFVVLECLEGRDLGARLREGVALHPSEAVEYVIHACAGLAEAHAAGAAHGDIKPEHLFLVRRPDGSPLVKVLGFGVARLAPRGGEVPPIDRAEGATPPPSLYSSPEQLRPDDRPDPRSDIWSLGAVLFELLTARPAFPAASLPELCAMVLEQPVPRASAFRPELPAGLDEAIGRCLSREPAERFQNVADLAVALLPFAPRRASAAVEQAATALGLPFARLAAANAPSGSFLIAPSSPPRVAPPPSAPSSLRPVEAASELKARRTLQIGTAIALVMIGAGLFGFALERRSLHQSAAPLNVVDRAADAPASSAPPAKPEVEAADKTEASLRAEPAPRAEASQRVTTNKVPHKPRSVRPSSGAGTPSLPPPATDLEIRLKR